MAPNDSHHSATSQPSAPSPGLVLFNSEEQSDIVFMVGNEGEPSWRIPAHSFIVENASPVFKAIVDTTDRTGQQQTTIRQINYCKPEVFRIILRYIYTNEIAMGSVPTALTLFTAANQFLLNDLCRQCLAFLYDHCRADNVLDMLAHFTQFSYLRPAYLAPDINTFNGAGGCPSSPSALNRQSSLQFHSNCDNVLNELITRCYHTLDREAAVILESEAFANLEHDLVVKILSRDTLNVATESTVWEAIKSWSCQQCARECRELTADNRRSVLGKALYCPRYLTMTADEFMRGPHAGDLLSEQERQALLARLTGDAQWPLPVHLTGRKLDVRRAFVDQSPARGSRLADDRVLSADMSPTDGSMNGRTSGANAGIVAKKKSTSKKLLNGLGDLVICVIRLLD
ncbi:unnamed protein product [Oppiella nova]|uniref:BTB domain-containing protein n=1 Tax=Oppiella nova TaxID=334625 RepID=A0A7R9MGG1_9ACAR|nr:unnamed protein product [Oppiella nova]CAG2176612.1 unnamed protein product [Oppiella nova]